MYQYGDGIYSIH